MALTNTLLESCVVPTCFDVVRVEVQSCSVAACKTEQSIASISRARDF